MADRGAKPATAAAPGRGAVAREAAMTAERAAQPGSRSRRTRPAGAPDNDPTVFIDGYLAYLLARASHVVSSRFHSLVRTEGLSVLEWRVLATLYDTDSVSVGQLAGIVLAQQPTLTKLLARMQADGMVRRAPDAGDRRRTLVQITAAGRARVASLIRQARRHEADVLAPFGSARVEALKTVLRGMIDGSPRSAPRRASR